MLVDLGRNDLGRVCRYGSVKVPAFKTRRAVLARHAHRLRRDGPPEGGPHGVRHLPGLFPAGTLSGAPKIRAMEIIDELEPSQRGLTAGRVNFGYNGTWTRPHHPFRAVYRDLNGHPVAAVQAGAGLVADSDPKREYQECCNKARAVLWRCTKPRDLRGAAAPAEGSKPWVLVIDNFDSSPTTSCNTSANWGRRSRSYATTRSSRGHPGAGSQATSHLAGPLLARKRRLGGRRAVLRGEDPHPGRVPGHQSIGAAFGGHWRAKPCTSNGQPHLPRREGRLKDCPIRSRPPGSIPWHPARHHAPLPDVSARARRGDHGRAAQDLPIEGVQFTRSPSSRRREGPPLQLPEYKVKRTR